MSLTNFPNGVTSFGMPIMGSGDLVTTGSYFFVHSGTGSSSFEGTSPAHPLATINQALAKCTASKGDIVIVMPGHTETISAAAGVAMTKAGVSVIGLGSFNNRPILTFSATTSDFDIDAANCRVSNIKFVSSVNNLAMFLDVNAGQFQIDNCLFVTGSTTEAYGFINLATTFDDFKILNCEFFQPTDPSGVGAAVNTGAIYCVDSENILIEDCTFRGQFESAIVHNKTTACKGLVIKRCELSNELTVPLLLVVTAEGVAHDCYGATLGASDATEAQIWGTIGTIFWISGTTTLGNDSGGGGQLAAPGTAVCS